MEIKGNFSFSTTDDVYMCFRHAVQEAIAGVDVSIDFEDYGSEYYLGRTWCEKCVKEASNESSGR